MGLDMYLRVRKYVSRIDFSKGYDEQNGYTTNERFDNIVKAMDMEKFIDQSDSAGVSVEIPVMYWRKANAIHKWFVDMRADGVDECQPIEANTEHLKELLELCKEVMANKDDHDKVDELLPTESGFFFGGTEYDEHYFADIEYTISRLGEVVRMMEETPDTDWAVYQASW